MLGEVTSGTVSRRRLSFWLLPVVVLLGAVVNLRLVGYYAGFYGAASTSTRLDDDAYDTNGYHRERSSHREAATTRQLLTTSPQQGDSNVPKAELNETQQLLLRTFRYRISPDRPLLFLDLGNSGFNAVQRYFTCAGLDLERELGSLFTHRLQRTDTIARCIQRNVIPNIVQTYDKKSTLAQDLVRQFRKTPNPRNDPLLGCGNFSVWTGLTDAKADTSRSLRKCFFPSLSTRFLEQLAHAYPRATIVHVQRNPRNWYNTLSYDLRWAWPDMCDATVDFEDPKLAFPRRDDSEETWVEFYRHHNNQLRQFAKTRQPSWNYIELELEEIQESANVLQQQLGLDGHCWRTSVSPPLPTLLGSSTVGMARKRRRPRARTGHSQKSHDHQPPPNDITYPILVTALPKSGTSTTHDYFQCGQGRGTGAHQWTWRTSDLGQIPVGECMETNIQQNRSLLEDCGLYRVWTDVGFFHGNACFYPSIHGGLEAFYKAHPYGTLMNVIRNDTAWHASCVRWKNLPKRWARGNGCKGFPAPGASAQDWIEFSVWHRHLVRTFAHEHPTLTYVEVPLEDDETPAKLQHIFGFPQECWGKANVNKGRRNRREATQEALEAAVSNLNGASAKQPQAIGGEQPDVFDRLQLKGELGPEFAADDDEEVLAEDSEGNEELYEGEE